METCQTCHSLFSPNKDQRKSRKFVCPACRWRLRQERKEIVYKMFAEGHTYQQIAEKFGVSRQRIQQIVRPSQEVYVALRGRAMGRCEECGDFIGDNGHAHHADRNITGHMGDLLILRYLCRKCHFTEDAWMLCDENGERKPIIEVEIAAIACPS